MNRQPEVTLSTPPLFKSFFSSAHLFCTSSVHSLGYSVFVSGKCVETLTFHLHSHSSSLWDK